MIYSKIFETEEDLNKFIKYKSMQIISIESIKIIEDTGVATMRTGTLKVERDRIKLWYKIGS